MCTALREFVTLSPDQSYSIFCGSVFDLVTREASGASLCCCGCLQMSRSVLPLVRIETFFLHISSKQRGIWGTVLVRGGGGGGGGRRSSYVSPTRIFNCFFLSLPDTHPFTTTRTHVISAQQCRVGPYVAAIKHIVAIVCQWINLLCLIVWG